MSALRRVTDACAHAGECMWKCDALMGKVGVIFHDLFIYLKTGAADERGMKRHAVGGREASRVPFEPRGSGVVKHMVESFLGTYLLISVGPLRLSPRASLGGAVGAVLLALTLLELGVLGGGGLSGSCGREGGVSVCSCLRPRRRVLTVSLRLAPVALLRGILLLAEGLLAGALLILSLLLAVLGVTYRGTDARVGC